MPVKVLDASAVATIVFDEPDSARITSLLDGADLQAPTLLPYEIANIAWKKARRGSSNRAGIVAGLQDALRMDISLTAPDPAAILELALETGLTAYDASYL